MCIRFTKIQPAIFYIFLLPAIVHSQCYPKWFLHQGRLSQSSAVGYSKSSFYPDSSISIAVLNGIENFARQVNVSIAGGQAFWTTEIGNIWLGSDIHETFDSARIELNSYNVLDTSHCRNITLILISQGDNNFDSSLKELECINDSLKPSWINNIPSDPNYLYATGIAPEYYYEISSWREAERNVRLSLARQINVQIKSLQKMTKYEGQDIKTEEIVVMLNDLEVMERWRDQNKKFYYVLMRMRV